MDVKMGGLTLKNKIVRSATNESLCLSNGNITKGYFRVYEELAKNQIGLIISSHFSVTRDYRAHDNQAILDEKSDLSLLQEVTKKVHEYDSKIIAQISHAGEKSVDKPFILQDATKADFEEIEEAFMKAAMLAKEANFDGVQLHGAHGYFFSTMMDPGVNKREDEFGGSLENKSNLFIRLIKNIKKQCGKEFVVLVKINANASIACDYTETLVAYAKAIETAGCDGIELSGLRLKEFDNTNQEPYFLTQALSLKENVNIPIILVGGIRTMKMLKDILSKGIDFASLSRPLIRQPDLLKLSPGKQFTCIHCNQCFVVPRTAFKRCVFDKTENPYLEELYATTK